MKLLSALAVVALATATLATSAMAGTKRVNIGDDWFVRSGAGTPLVTITKGSYVTWVWVGKVAHNVYSIKGPTSFHSTTRVKGTYTKRFTRRGTYTLICTIHPGMDMKLRIT